MATSTSPPYRKSKQSSNQARVSVSEKWLRAIVSADEITEVFVKGAVSGSDSFNLVGFYDSLHLGKLATDVAAYSGVAKGVYFRINPIKRSLLARAPNQLLPTSKACSGTSDDITRRRLLMIDVDANRPTGTNATDDEKLQAQRLRDAVIEFLKEQSWPGPAYVDSGNGYCLFYRVDLPVEDNGLVRGVLKLLDRTLSTHRAHIDAGVHDPARLARLPGTMNCKGEHAVDRPQRPCRLLRLPIKGLQTVPRALLECAVTIPEASAVDTEATVATANPDVISRARAYIAKMPSAVAESGGDSATYTVACRLVIGFGLSPKQAMPLMREYNGRCLPPWTETELLHKVNAAYERAMQTGIARGQLAAETTYVELPRLSGGTFHGWVPDFGDVSAVDVLAPIGQFELVPQHNWIELFSGWQTLSSYNDLPDVFLRQCYYGASYPRNWRKRFRNLVENKTIEEKALKSGFKYACPDHGCILRSCDVRHGHFSGFFDQWGVLESFADSDEDGHSFRPYAPESSERRKALRKERRIIKVYEI